MVSLHDVQQRLNAIVSGLGMFSRTMAGYVLSSPGKLIRPTLVIASSNIFGPRSHIDQAVADVASAVELIHVASLIHDDIADGACLRRNKPSLNARYGNLVAVLAGDTLFAAAFELLETHAHLGVLTTMCRAVNSMIEGELAEIHNRWNLAITEEEYLHQVALKTASLFGACCEAGARLGGASTEQADMLREFGTAVGIAFQVLDDILDFTEDPASLGKPCLVDVRQGTFTLPVIYALSADSARQFLAPLLAPGLSMEEAACIGHYLRESGYIQKAAATGRELLHHAEGLLKHLPPGDGTDTLLEIVARLEQSIEESSKSETAQQPAASKQ